LTAAVQKAVDTIAEYSRALTATSALMLAILGGFLGDQPDRAAGAEAWLVICWVSGGVAILAGLVLQGRLVSILSDSGSPQTPILLHAARSKVVQAAGLVQAVAFLAILGSVIMVLARVEPRAAPEGAAPITTVRITATSTTTHQTWPSADEIK
jgi:hypothetical protein